MEAQLESCRRLLAEIGLLSSSGIRDWRNAVDVSLLRGQSYRQQWATSARKSWFDFMLVDGSFFQFEIFSMRPFQATYRFIEVPYIAMTVAEFRSSSLYVADDGYATLDEQYSAYVDSAPIKPHVLPLRYDADPRGYATAGHPASHLHFGFETSPRVQTLKFWRPVTFVLFVVRQMYPAHWTSATSCNDWSQYRGHVRTSLDEVPSQYFGVLDQFENSLH